MAVTVPSTTAQFAKEIDPAVKKHFVDEYKRVAPMIEKIVQVGTQEDFNQQEQTVFGLGELAVVPEAQNYTVDAPIQGYTTTYTPVTYGKLLQISRQLSQYDKSGMAKATKNAAMRGNAAASTVSTQAASLFNNGFSTSYTSYGDAKPLFSTVHPSAAGGSSQSNASATGITLTEANLETAVIAFRQQNDDRGLPTACVPTKLLVPLALEKEALIITKSEKRSGTADNDANVNNLVEYKGGIRDVLAWRYLDAGLSGSDTAWFLLDTDPMSGHKVEWKWGVKPMIGERNESEGYRNDTIYYKVMFEASKGWSDWRGVWGSKGDGLAYAS